MVSESIMQLIIDGASEKSDVFIPAICVPVRNTNLHGVDVTTKDIILYKAQKFFDLFRYKDNHHFTNLGACSLKVKAVDFRLAYKNEVLKTKLGTTNKGYYKV